MEEAHLVLSVAELISREADYVVALQTIWWRLMANLFHAVMWKRISEEACGLVTCVLTYVCASVKTNLCTLSCGLDGSSEPGKPSLLVQFYKQAKWSTFPKVDTYKWHSFGSKKVPISKFLWQSFTQKNHKSTSAVTLVNLLFISYVQLKTPWFNDSYDKVLACNSFLKGLRFLKTFFRTWLGSSVG